VKALITFEGLVLDLTKTYSEWGEAFFPIFTVSIHEHLNIFCKTHMTVYISIYQLTWPLKRTSVLNIKMCITQIAEWLHNCLWLSSPRVIFYRLRLLYSKSMVFWKISED